MIKKISKKDKKDWEKFLANKEKLPNKDIVVSNKIGNKTKVIDLHGQTLAEANDYIESLIKDSFKKGIRKLIVITGKGIHSNIEKDPYKSKDYSILRYSVPEFIKKNDDLTKIIYDISEADQKDGGKGAFYIYLKKNNNNS